MIEFWINKGDCGCEHLHLEHAPKHLCTDICVYAYVFSIQSVSFHGVKRSNLEKHIRHPNVSQLNMGIEMRPQTTLLVSKKDMETQSDKKQDIYQIGGSIIKLIEIDLGILKYRG